MKPKEKASRLPKARGQAAEETMQFDVNPHHHSLLGNNPVIAGELRLDPKIFPGPERRKMDIVSGISMADWIQDQQVIAEHNGTPLEIPVTHVFNPATTYYVGRQSRDGSMRRMCDFTREDVMEALNEISNAIRFLEDVWRQHPELEVWTNASRCLADAAYAVLRRKPAIECLQEPFAELWERGHSIFGARWEELAKQGLPKDAASNPVRRVLTDAVATALSYVRVRDYQIAIWVAGQTDVGRINRNLVCQEQEYETIDGVKLDQMSALLFHFYKRLLPTDGHRFSHPFNDLNYLGHIIIANATDFERNVTRPFLTYGAPSLWQRDIMPILKKAKGAKHYPADNETTMVSIIEQQLAHVKRAGPQ